MTVFYVKLKTGEELLGHVDVEALSQDTEATHVLVSGPISFDPDPETGTTVARYWVAYSDHKDVNIDLNDCYFFGTANDHANKFYEAFLESVAERESIQNIDGVSDEDLEEIFSNPSRTLH